MSNNQQLPAELQKAIRESMANGGPLPPGVVALKPGQTPPPGAIPIQIPMGGNQAQRQAPPSREQANPIPDGDEGINVLRNFAECPIPQEATKLHRLVQTILKTEPADDSVIEETISKGLAATMRAPRYCMQNLKTRVAGTFENDPTLKELHEHIQEEQRLLDKLNAELNECVKRGNDYLDKRWKQAVKTFGLSPEKYSYRINEEAGSIEQVDLDCVGCKGSVIIRKARQEVTEKLMGVQGKEGEVKND